MNVAVEGRIPPKVVGLAEVFARMARTIGGEVVVRRSNFPLRQKIENARHSRVGWGRLLVAYLQPPTRCFKDHPPPRAEPKPGPEEGPFKAEPDVHQGPDAIPQTCRLRKNLRKLGRWRFRAEAKALAGRGAGAAGADQGPRPGRGRSVAEGDPERSGHVRAQRRPLGASAAPA